MTPQEKRLWQYLRANALDRLHFRRQVTIDGFIADFYCHEVGIVVEVDGAVHENQREYDALREQIIAARGLRILRFTNTQIETQISAVLADIRKAAQETPHQATTVAKPWSEAAVDTVANTPSPSEGRGKPNL